MKLRVHYEYKFKVRTKDFSGSEINLDDLQERLASSRKADGLVNFTDDRVKGFSLPARSVVLMEVID